jgi:hypothetical protein
MAYDYNGTDHGARLGEAPMPATSTGSPFTVALWFKPARTDATETVVNLAALSQARIAVEIVTNTTTSSGRVNFRSINQFGNGHSVVAPSALTVNEWHHVVGVQAVMSTSSFGTRRVYLNGTVATAQNTANQAFTATFDEFRIAHRKTATQATALGSYFQGALGEVAVWSDALGIDDIKALASGAKPTSVRPDLLTCYLPLIRQLGDVVETRAITNTYVTSTAAASVTAHPRRFG